LALAVAIRGQRVDQEGFGLAGDLRHVVGRVGVLVTAHAVAALAGVGQLAAAFDVALRSGRGGGGRGGRGRRRFSLGRQYCLRRCLCLFSRILCKGHQGGRGEGEASSDLHRSHQSNSTIRKQSRQYSSRVARLAPAPDGESHHDLRQWAILKWVIYLATTPNPTCFRTLTMP